MDELARLRIYTAEYYAAAAQHQTSRIAREWMEMGIPAGEAARWANLGYLPVDAWPLIEQGVTPELAGDMDEMATEIAGSPEERAMQIIDRLVETGVLVDPQRVRRWLDPDDPTVVVVHIDGPDEPGGS